MDSERSILKSARSFLAGTLLSRFSGLGRDIAMAVCFGSSPEIAAFMVAYRLANLFRRLLGEGNLQAGFVPHYEAAEKEGRGETFYRNIFYSFSIVLLAVVLLLELVFGVCWWAIPSWRDVIGLSMWMVPGLFFICLYALNSSRLQCQRRYFLPGAAPIAFNAVWIIATLFLAYFPKETAVHWLAIAVTLGFAGQWLATSRFRMQGKPELFSSDWKALLKPLGLGVVGIGAVQFNSALDAIFARLADAKGPAYLWYAIRIEQLPMALFGVALSGALLPPLSRAFGDSEKYRRLLLSALRSCGALLIPCTFGILALGGVGLNLLYGHGNFTEFDLAQTLLCLWAYSLGLIPSVLVLLLASGFYAQKSYRIPTLASIASVLLNIALNALFVFGFRWGAVSIAMATSIGAFLNAFILIKNLKVGPVFTVDLRRFFLRVSFCSAVPAALVSELERVWIGFHMPRYLPEQLTQFLVLSFLYASLLALLAWRFKLKELIDLFPRIRTEEGN